MKWFSLRWFSAVFLAFSIYFVTIATLITFGPQQTPNSTAKVAIVLGAGIDGDVPSPVFAARIDHAIDLHNRGRVAAIIFTGARSPEDSVSEAAAGRNYAIAAGIPASDITIEENSRTTFQNLVEAQKLMEANGQVSALVVSDPLHLWRADMMAEDLGISAQMSETPTTRYQTLSTILPFLLREVYFVHHYWILGE
ncbi:MAG: YdcF family protein [Pseudomonadota bacterium]